MILSGAFLLIYNVLSITLGNDIRQYGLLKTIGTTGSQIRKIVLSDRESDPDRVPVGSCGRFTDHDFSASQDSGRIICTVWRVPAAWLFFIPGFWQFSGIGIATLLAAFIAVRKVMSSQSIEIIQYEEQGQEK